MSVSYDSESLNKYYIYENYIKAIIGFGGIPLLIPYLQNKEDIKKICDTLDGLVLSGGIDVDPKQYNQEASKFLEEVNIERDSIELSLGQYFLTSNRPILGICRGCQVLAVLTGGELYQDIASELPSSDIHQQNEWNGFCHDINIIPDTKLFNICDNSYAKVNSFHHQSVKSLADPFVVSAISKDGIIEAIESTYHKFVIGVQWHPERLIHYDDFSGKLFSAFIDNCIS